MNKHCDIVRLWLLELQTDSCLLILKQIWSQKDLSLSALALFLVAACLCLTEGRSHGNSKMNALIKRLEMALAPSKAVLAGEAVVADVRDQCDSILYWCPPTDSCCLHPAGNNPGVDGDWFCCQPDANPTICASTADACYMWFNTLSIFNRG